MPALMTSCSVMGGQYATVYGLSLNVGPPVILNSPENDPRNQKFLHVVLRALNTLDSQELPACRDRDQKL